MSSARRRTGALSGALVVATALFAAPPVAAQSGGVDAYASVEASVSPAGTARVAPTAPLPLARSDASGELVYRAGAGAPSSVDCRWPDERTLAAIVAVATDRGSHASGVVFAPNRVLTAAHAVADGTRFFVRIGDGYRSADMLTIDHDTDLAVLALDTRGIEPLPIARHGPFERQPVWAVGFPRSEGKTTSSGVFQRSREGALHTSAPIDSGQSGGGLLVCDRGAYRLLGMLRGYGAYRSGDRYVKLENHSVSVAAATIHRFLAAGL